MLHFYGGEPELLVPDNLKAAVTRASCYAPKINDTYAEIAAHYGTAILPTRPCKPEDKAEAVQLVKRWILARLRHRTYFSLPEWPWTSPRSNPCPRTTTNMQNIPNLTCSTMPAPAANNDFKGIYQYGL